MNLVSKTHKKDFDNWLEQLNKIGYKTIWGKVNSHDFGLLQARSRVFALSIYDPQDKLNWDKNNRDDLVIELKEIYQNEFKPSWIQKHKEVFDFKNVHKEESKLCQMKNTPSRVKMRDLGLTITEEYKGKISTVTTKQDRWPNVGNLIGVYRDPDTKGVPYLDERFITPREAYKLMGFTDEQYERAHNKMNEVCVSNVAAREKLYKQAGNSIAVNSLEMIFYYMKKLDKEVK